MDTASSAKDLSWFFSQGWSSIVVALVIYGGGITAEQIVMALWPQTRDVVTGKVKTLDPSLPAVFRIWWVTRLAHPFLVGAAISFIPGLPAPDFVTSHTSGALWFGLAGMGNATIHAFVQSATNQASKAINMIAPWVRQKLGLPASISDMPPAPAHDPIPSTVTKIPRDTPSDQTVPDKTPSDPPPPEAA